MSQNEQLSNVRIECTFNARNIIWYSPACSQTKQNIPKPIVLDSIVVTNITHVLFKLQQNIHKRYDGTLFLFDRLLYFRCSKSEWLNVDTKCIVIAWIFMQFALRRLMTKSIAITKAWDANSGLYSCSHVCWYRGLCQRPVLRKLSRD